MRWDGASMPVLPAREVQLVPKQEDLMEDEGDEKARHSNK